jgi:hypothetical protein
VASTVLSVGYVVWLIRGGSLVMSFVTSLPSWTSFDPLPIVASFEEAEQVADDEDSLQSMVS